MQLYIVYRVFFLEEFWGVQNNTEITCFLKVTCSINYLDRGVKFLSGSFNKDFKFLSWLSTQSLGFFFFFFYFFLGYLGHIYFCSQQSILFKLLNYLFITCHFSFFFLLFITSWRVCGYQLTRTRSKMGLSHSS